MKYTHDPVTNVLYDEAGLEVVYDQETGDLMYRETGEVIPDPDKPAPEPKLDDETATTLESIKKLAGGDPEKVDALLKLVADERAKKTTAEDIEDSQVALDDIKVELETSKGDAWDEQRRLNQAEMDLGIKTRAAELDARSNPVLARISDDKIGDAVLDLEVQIESNREWIQDHRSRPDRAEFRQREREFKKRIDTMAVLVDELEVRKERRDLAGALRLVQERRVERDAERASEKEVQSTAELVGAYQKATDPEVQAAIRAELSKRADIPLPFFGPPSGE